MQLPFTKCVPVGHIAVQTPAEHAAVPPLTTHLRPQAPQLLTSLLIDTSQPSCPLLLQSAKPLLQAPIRHCPAEHAGVPLATAAQVPQFKEPPQPSATVPQLAPTWPQVLGIQARTQTPLVQTRPGPQEALAFSST